MKKQWISPQSEISSEKIEALAAAENLSLPIARMVLQRAGADLDHAQRFLNPQLKFLRSPHDLPDIGKALERTVKAIRNNEIIAVHGDYDVDGTVAVALLCSTLRTWGATVIPFIPERNIDGYGLSRRGIEEVRSAGANLLITCDCGITAFDEVEYAKSLGLDVIVTDHHLPSAQGLPKALAVVNPQRDDSQYAFGGICGTGVAFCFLIALRSALREIGHFTSDQGQDLREALDFVALATLADSVPLVDDNRIFVSKGMQMLAQTRRPGLQALLEITGLVGKKLSAWDVVFKLVPRLNVAGRLNQVKLSLNLLLAQDAAEAKALAQQLDELNVERKRIELDVRTQAITMIETQDMLSARALVVAGDEWHRGVIGIVAAKLSERFSRPAAVIAFGGDEGTGSIRGMAGVNLVEAMEHCKAHLKRHGGHSMAAGLTVMRGQYDEFRNAFLDYMNKAVDERTLEASLRVDADMNFSALSEGFLHQLEMLEPFGEANPEPVFASYQVEVCEARIVGETHLKMVLEQQGRRKDAIGFGRGAQLSTMGKTVDLAFTPRWNEFRGRRTIQLDIKDLR